MSPEISAVLLGVVEGVTEFLPISSTGHLIIAADLLRFPDSGGAFEVVVQFGAVLAVLWYYRAVFADRLKNFTQTSARKFWFNLGIAFLPAAIVGLLLHQLIKDFAFNPTVVAISLIVGGLILLLVESRKLESAVCHLEDISPKRALLIGMIQVTALIPGISRSGATIVGGLLVGLDRVTATAFSFFLAVPVLGAAALFDLTQNWRLFIQPEWLLPLLVGLLASFIVSLLVISWLINFVSSHNFKPFAWYRIILGVLVFLFIV